MAASTAVTVGVRAHPPRATPNVNDAIHRRLFSCPSLVGFGVALLVALLTGAPSAVRANGGHYTVEDGVHLGPQMEPVIVRIADEFHRRTGRSLEVTSGTRSPVEQADAMYDKITLGQHLTSLYRDFDAATEIQHAYRSHRREGRARCVSAMAQVISRQVRRGCLISRHLSASAADVRSRGMNRRERGIFVQVVRSVRGVSLLEEGTPPHFHLQLSE